MSRRLKTRQNLAIGICVGLLLAFQNCAQVENSASMSAASTYENDLPLAYDVKLDTIAYMSCSEIKDYVEPRAYFSLRAMAYNSNTGGIKLTDEFKKATQYYSPAQRANLLSGSTINANTLLSLSIRSAGDFQAPWVAGELRRGEAIDSFLPPLDDPMIAGPVANLPDDFRRINYFPGKNNYLMQASLRYYEFENVAVQTRRGLEDGTSFLVAALSGSTNTMDTELKTAGGNTAYGSGFQLAFSTPVGYTGGERRVLKPTGGITEYDLTKQNGQIRQDASWKCPTQYQFMVIRPEDKAANKVICNATVDRYTDAAQKEALDAIRRVLRAEDWFVDLANKCIMPKRTQDLCYGDLKGRTIDYGKATCPSATGACPHFVSVCIRY